MESLKDLPARAPLGGRPEGSTGGILEEASHKKSSSGTRPGRIHGRTGPKILEGFPVDPEESTYGGIMEVMRQTFPEEIRNASLP